MMSIAPVRTITFGIEDPHPLPLHVIKRASQILQLASRRYQEAGYEVQTTRLSTRSLFDDLPHWSSAEIVHYVQALQQMLDDAGMDFCSLGTVQAARTGFPLERLDAVADVLISTNMSMTVQLATVSDGLREEAALPAARIVQRLAQETAEGFGNFRFAVLACVTPGTPFFPAAYHAGPASLSLGLQGAGVVTEALRANAPEHGDVIHRERVSEVVREALIAAAQPVIALGQQIAQEQRILFGGIDLSPAPMGKESIVNAIESCGAGPLGAPGTLAVAAAMTTALKSTGLPTCGYCGLMLPVLEDAMLGRRWTEGCVGIDDLLLYSAVCGTGLDTIPLPGDYTIREIAHIFYDVATLALRLQKPLSARLFPVPGKGVGDQTTFTSPYLTNTILRR